MTTNLLPISTNSLLPAAQEFQMFQTIAKSAKASGLYGGDENKIFMVMLAARELGISPMLALNGGIWNIQGKIEISARLMNSMIRRAGHTMHITGTATECTIKGKRSDTGEEQTEIFTWAMAEKAGLTKGNVWQKYPEDMLYNRCMSRLARRLFPDVIGIAYVEGEIREATEKEKQLPEMQYEDITPMCENDTKMNHVQVDTKISQEQLNVFLDTCKLVDAETIKNMDALLKDHYNILNYSEMNKESFERCMRWLSNNIEMNKKKVIL